MSQKTWRFSCFQFCEYVKGSFRLETIYSRETSPLILMQLKKNKHVSVRIGDHYCINETSQWNIYNHKYCNQTKQRAQWRSEAGTQENRKKDQDAVDQRHYRCYLSGWNNNSIEASWPSKGNSYLTTTYQNNPFLVPRESFVRSLWHFFRHFRVYLFMLACSSPCNYYIWRWQLLADLFFNPFTGTWVLQGRNHRV